MAGCCEPCENPCVEQELGCLQQIDAECVFVDDVNILEILNLEVTTNLEEILQEILNYVDTTINNYEYAPTGLGASCIPGGAPFDFDTWLQNLEDYVCTLEQPLTFDNALERTLQNVQWGGDLVKDTSVNGLATYSVLFNLPLNFTVNASDAITLQTTQGSLVINDISDPFVVLTSASDMDITATNGVMNLDAGEMNLTTVLGDIYMDSVADIHLDPAGGAGILLDSDTIKGATAVNGYVWTLVDSATGEGEWQVNTAVPIITAQNAITQPVAGTVEWGGALIQDTQVDGGSTWDVHFLAPADFIVSLATNINLGTTAGNAGIDIANGGGGTLAITAQGSPGTPGQVLTSDGTFATWQDPAVTITADNGLTLTGSNVQWGGDLIQNTAINGQTFNLDMTNFGTLTINGNTSTFIGSNGTFQLDADTTLQVNVAGNPGLANQVLTSDGSFATWQDQIDNYVDGVTFNSYPGSGIDGQLTITSTGAGAFAGVVDLYSLYHENPVAPITNTIEATSDNSLAIGQGNVIPANVTDVVLIGLDNIAGGSADRSYAFGRANTVGFWENIALGYNNSATSGEKSGALGADNVSTSPYALAIGRGCTTSQSPEVGSTGADSQVAIGYGAVSYGRGSVALGRSANAYSYGEVAVGLVGTPYVPSIVGTNGALGLNTADRVFNVGIGTSGTPEDIFTILKSGRIGVNLDNFEAVVQSVDEIFHINSANAGAVRIVDTTEEEGKYLKAINNDGVAEWDYLEMFVDNMVYVDLQYGDDTTGRREDFARPFQTIASALAVMLEGDTLYLRNGTYTGVNAVDHADVALCSATNVVIQLQAGTVVEFETIGSNVDLLNKTYKIIGEGDNTVQWNGWLPYDFDLEIYNIALLEVGNSVPLNTNGSVYLENIKLINFNGGGIAINSPSAPAPLSANIDYTVKNCVLVGTGSPSQSVISVGDPAGGTTPVINLSMYNCEVSNFNHFFEQQSSLGGDFVLNTTLVDCNIQTTGEMWGNTARATATYSDDFKNCTFESTGGSGQAYEIPPTAVMSSVTMKDVRFIGVIAPAIEQNVSMQLQNVWSNLWITGAGTPTFTQERIHYFGENGQVTAGAGAYAVDRLDGTIIKTAITGGGDNVDLPSGAYKGQRFTIVDGAGTAGTDNITVRDPALATVAVINGNNNSVVVEADGAGNFYVVASAS